MPSVEQRRLQTSFILRCHSKVIKILGKITDVKADGNVKNFDFYTHLRLYSNFSHVKLTHIF